MLYENLLNTLRVNGPYASVEDAQRALVTTLETLGYFLPNELVRQLATALPSACSGPLQLGMQASDGVRRLAHAHGACEPSELPEPVLAEMRTVCGAIHGLLPFELARTVGGVLPPPLKDAFARFIPAADQPVAAQDGLERTAHHEA
jgi:uncharacterized protein (DUF2267 family)